MELTAKEIAEKIEGRIIGNESTLICGAAALEEATPSDISFLRDSKARDASKNLLVTKAGAVFVPEGTPSNGRTFIEVKNPLAAFSKILKILAEEISPKTSGIHPSAVIAPSAHIGKNVVIGPLTVIEDNAIVEDNSRIMAQCYIGAHSKIGMGTKLYPQVIIRENIQIGENCILHAGSIIGSDGYGFYFEKERHNKIPHIGNVIIEDDVEIGSGTTVDRATTGSTFIRKGTKIDNLVQVAHNVDVGEHCLLVAQVAIGGSSRLEQGVVLGGQVGVADHTRIGKGSQVGAQSGIKGEIPPGSRLFGSPGQPIHDTIKQLFLIRRLPELFKDVKKAKEALNKNG